MAAPRAERQRQQRREALERALADPDAPDREDLCFHDHGELVAGFAAALEQSDLVEACLGWARYLEEDRDHWLRRLERIEAEPALRARRAALEAEYLEAFAVHFRRWGAGGAQGERASELEAACLLGALRGAERLWLRERGRPILPVLVQEAVGLLWPALYAHARRHL